MIWLIGIASLLLLLLILVMITPVTLRFRFMQKKANQDLHLKITVWRVFYKTFELPIISFEEETGSVVMKEKTKTSTGNEEERDIKETPQEIKSQLEGLRLWINHIAGLRPILHSFLNKWKITEFSWKSKIGTGEAAWTGFLSGTLWSVKNIAVGLMSAVFKLKCAPDIDIAPEFQKPALDVDLSCMVSVRLGHAIIAGIRVMKHLRGNMFKLWKKSKEEMRREEAS
ncbi:DUF2953 domain-containing protein [Salibacterium salarium]|uniref:DUF2953 domain-containing protein n=1 Tax=Salibacterium salarium TaxID=284579 RepID=A0A428N3F4_9BACI|nr:DUF2953 domain-containing protein [Salibacterium salarium]RSL32941.1 DUF2953 domain-containing protein [Salibacterium salarium]